MREIAPNPALSQAVADLAIARGEVSALIGDHVNYTLAPHASNHGNLSSDLARDQRLSGFRKLMAGATLLATGTAGIGIASGAPVFGQGPTEAPSSQDPNATIRPVETGTPEPGGSVAPSEDPITGVLPSCPPEVSPSPTPLVEPTPPIIAVINGKEFTLVDNTVTVRALAQDAPASPLASPLASENPETALLDNPNCEPDPNGSPTPSAVPSTGPSAVPTEAPTPDRTFSPEEIEGLLTGEFSVDAFIALEDESLDEAGFKKIIKRGASAMADFLQRHGEPDATREQVIQKETDNLADLTKDGWSMNYTGRGIISRVSFSIEKAQQAVREGNIAAAKAFRNRGHAYLRVGLTLSKDPSLEKLARNDAKSLNLR